MRKAIPFVLTVVVSMLCTATLVRAASSSGETTLQPSSVAPSELLGSGLDLNTCNNSPKNATEWTRFAKCMTGNVFKIQRWGKVLDTCLTTYQVTDHANDIYGDPADPLTFQNHSGLGSAELGDTFRYFVGWKKQAGCPQA